MFKFTRAIAQTKSNNLNNYFRVFLSSSLTVEPKITQNEVAVDSNIKSKRSKRGIVETAFALLQTEPFTEVNTPHTDKRILSATTIDELLSISSGNGISRRHALKVVSVLSEWSSKGKVSVLEFESDPRFLKLCRVLSKTTSKFNTVSQYSTPNGRSEDLSTILSITADDEAAKLVSSITVPQMIKVMTSLSQKKRRSLMLLRALAHNITQTTTVLNLKQCSDLLYGMAVLNFPDENLLAKICDDISKEINDDIEKSSVIGSILTSLGLLKYKNPVVLEDICRWMVKHSNGCRPQDIITLFMTLATLNFQPTNSDEVFPALMQLVTTNEISKPSILLEFVWSLVLLNRATIDHISSVLDEEFTTKLYNDNSFSISNKLKLLNVDSAAQHLIKNYNGPRLPDNSEIKMFELPRSKEKEAMCASVIDCFKNLASEKCFKTKVNTKMGYWIDIECVLDKKCAPVPIDTTLTSEHKRVAIVLHQFQDMCKGANEPTGVSMLGVKLLEKVGYKVLTIPYSEYSLADKLVTRVKYLDEKLKTIGK